jgi:hypothetical protein
MIRQITGLTVGTEELDFDLLNQELRRIEDTF